MSPWENLMPFDYYMLHIRWQHITKLKTGRFGWENARTRKDTAFWGLNPCFRYMEVGANYLPRRRAPVDALRDLPVMRARWATRQEMD